MNPKTTQEVPIDPTSGWPVLIGWLLALIATVLLIILFKWPVIFIPFVVLVLPGLYIVNPNQARVMVLFGKYKGSVSKNGFFWTNPFTMKHRISLRAHNLDGAVIKVNDLLGNPIEISCVVVWRVLDTARSMFDVEDYEHYVRVQSEAAVRQLASMHPYDEGQAEGIETTLRGSTEIVVNELQDNLQGRLEAAGIQVIEARLNHLAYAPEIASAMLQRQQAKAIVAARKQIVDGAVGMVEMALKRLKEEKIIELDDERRATLVGNLLVVLCGQATPQPIINTGGLYS
ncbi:MAG: SPFH domain-containing protein [Planctomycetota bacterium]|nr:MAG: SPFH domain-containing protein [Planctomycetota bacterium]